MNRADLEFAEKFQQYNYTHTHTHTHGHNAVLITSIISISQQGHYWHFKQNNLLYRTIAKKKKKNTSLLNKKGIFPKLYFIALLSYKVLFHSKKLLKWFCLLAKIYFLQQRADITPQYTTFKCFKSSTVGDQRHQYIHLHKRGCGLYFNAEKECIFSLKYIDNFHISPETWFCSLYPFILVNSYPSIPQTKQNN